jgi:hypothetical protein
MSAAGIETADGRRWTPMFKAKLDHSASCWRAASFPKALTSNNPRSSASIGVHRRFQRLCSAGTRASPA